MTDDKRRIEYMAVSEMMKRRHPQNPKDHNLGLIAQSFLTHGFGSSGMIDERTGLFLCGHGRAETLDMMINQKMDTPRYIEIHDGGWFAPVEHGYSSLNDAQALAYIVMDNKSTIDGGWNEPALAALLQEVANSTDVALKATGFDESEVDDLLRDLGQLTVDWSDAFDSLPNEDRQPFQQITFTLHDSQLENIKQAIVKSKDLGPFETESENSNGNALDRVCTIFLGAVNE